MKKFPTIDHFSINPPPNNYEELTSYHVLSSIVYHDFTYYSDKERSYLTRKRKRERNHFPTIRHLYTTRLSLEQKYSIPVSERSYNHRSRTLGCAMNALAAPGNSAC